MYVFTTNGARDEQRTSRLGGWRGQREVENTDASQTSQPLYTKHISPVASLATPVPVNDRSPKSNSKKNKRYFLKHFPNWVVPDLDESFMKWLRQIPGRTDLST